MPVISLENTFSSNSETINIDGMYPTTLVMNDEEQGKIDAKLMSGEGMTKSNGKAAYYIFYTHI